MPIIVDFCQQIYVTYFAAISVLRRHCAQAGKDTATRGQGLVPSRLRSAPEEEARRSESGEAARQSELDETAGQSFHSTFHWSNQSLHVDYVNRQPGPVGGENKHVLDFCPGDLRRSSEDPGLERPSGEGHLGMLEVESVNRLRYPHIWTAN
jgi:hypothetical protein